MRNCSFCNPKGRENGNQVRPIVDTDFMMICVIGHTLIGNRRKSGSLQILDKITGEVTYTDIKRCPSCGQLLYNDEEN